MYCNDEDIRWLIYSNFYLFTRTRRVKRFSRRAKHLLYTQSPLAVKYESGSSTLDNGDNGGALGKEKVIDNIAKRLA